MEIKRPIVFLIIGAAVLVVAGIVFLRPTKPALQAPPASSNQPASQNQLAMPLSRVISGNVLRISQADHTLTVGAYRLEDNKAVLASQKTVSFTTETLFVRQAPTAANPSAEATIASTEVKEGDVVQVTPVGAGDTEPLVAEKVIRLLLPPPPSPR